MCFRKAFEHLSLIVDKSGAVVSVSVALGIGHTDGLEWIPSSGDHACRERMMRLSLVSKQGLVAA